MAETRKTVTKVVASALIRDAEGRLLVLQRAKDYSEVATGKDMWEMPGGGIESGESILEALRREVLEETGLDIEAWRLRDVSNFLLSSPSTRSHRFHIFYESSIGVPPNIKLSHEHSAFRWVTTQELAGLNMLEPYKQVTN